MKNLSKIIFPLLFGTALVFSFVACEEENTEEEVFDSKEVVLLMIDEESIDNDLPPNDFADTDINDHIAAIGLRDELPYFSNNVGKIIDLFTGQVGDEGWYALKQVPDSWANAGPTNNGADNYLAAGPGLGSANQDVGQEDFLEGIVELTPLRATGLAMLKGKTVIAVVYDSDITINYSPLTGSLKGDNLGVVAFDVLEVTKRDDGSTSSLPKAQIRIRSVDELSALPLMLFSNPPVLISSDEPLDIAPPAVVPEIQLTDAP